MRIQKLIFVKSYVEECGGRRMFIGRMGEKNVDVNSYIIFVRFRDRVIEAGR